MGLLSGGICGKSKQIQENDYILLRETAQKLGKQCFIKSYCLATLV